MPPRGTRPGPPLDPDAYLNAYPWRRQTHQPSPDAGNHRDPDRPAYLSSTDHRDRDLLQHCRAVAFPGVFPLAPSLPPSPGAP